MGKRQVCEITSEDESVTVVTTPDGRCCLKVDLSAGGGGEAHMIVSPDIAAGSTGDMDIPCVDITSGLPFKPRRVDTLWVDEDGGGTFNSGSRGMAHLLDGTSIVRQGMAFQSFPIIGGNTYWDIYIGAWIVSGVGYLLTLTNSGVATTLRFTRTKIGTGYSAVGMVEVWGTP